MFEFEGRPIFVCGWPRGGTRMVANLVSSHPDVMKPDELPHNAWAAVLDAMDGLNLALGTKERTKEHWQSVQQDYFLNAIHNTYKPRDQGGARRFCNKTPSLERHYERIAANCPSHAPLFVFCARHPKSVIKSLMNMPWNNKSVLENLDRLHRGAHILTRMQKEGIAARSVQLDKIEPDQRRAATADIMAFLELDMAPEVERYVKKWPVAQPASKVVGTVRDLTDKEIAEIEAAKSYRDLCEQFGYA